jgi:membrane protein YdbS with pleckstrin-like domain
MADQSPKYSRRTVALFWLLIFSVVIGVLLYFEQIAVLYVLATLSLVALLLVVAFADLEHVGIEGGDNLSSRAE